jgi:hypothetical protein
MFTTARFLILLLCLASLQAQVAVVNPTVKAAGIDAPKVAALMQGRANTWDDGQKVVLVFARDPAADRHVLHIAGRERDLLLRGWKRLVFSGNGAMPLLAPSVDEALALVARTPGAVLVLDQAPADPKWQVVPLMVEAKN